LLQGTVGAAKIARQDHVITTSKVSTDTIEATRTPKPVALSAQV